VKRGIGLAIDTGTARTGAGPHDARRRLTRADVVVAAEHLVDEHGWDGLTMTDLAARLGVKAPSLYTHVRGLDDVRSELQVRTMQALSHELRVAATGRSEDDAFRTMTRALHDLARRWPHRYDGVTRAPIDRDALYGAALDSANVLGALFRSYGIGDATVEMQLAAFAVLHGVVDLEISGFFGTELDGDAVYELVVAASMRALAEAGRARTSPPGGTS